jgi:hypothetical protein
MNLGELEKFWTEPNFIEKTMENRQNFSLSNFYFHIKTLDDNHEIIGTTIFDRTIFYLQKDGLLVQQPIIEEYRPQWEASDIKKIETNLTNINFIPFLTAPKLYYVFKYSAEILKLSSPFSPPPFIISLPSRPKIDGNLNFWVYFLYLFDIMFIITFFYVLRKIYNRLQGVEELSSRDSFELVSISNRRGSDENYDNESPYLSNYGYIHKNNK